LIAEWNYRSCNPKPVDTPRAAHDVGDLGPHDFIGSASHKHPVSNCDKNDRDMLRNLGRSIPHPGMARKQPHIMFMSASVFCCKNCNNSTKARPIHTTGSSLSKSGRYWLRYSASCKHHHEAVPSSQHAWRRSKSVPIGTVASEIRSTSIGNDFHVSHDEIGLIFLEIRLVVDSSS
jgi:hypothetical protein